MSGKKSGKQASTAAFTVSAPAAYEKPKKPQKPKQDSSTSQTAPLAQKDDLFPIWGGIKLRQAQNMKDEGIALTMWQPWANLLVWGIKRFEGRVWDSDFRGRLWIHSATHSLEESDIKAMEEQYAHLGLPFPKHYPQSALLGCVDVVDMVSQENLRAWRARFEALPPDQRDKTDEYMFMDNSEMDFGSHSFGLTSLQPAFVADPFVISAAFVCVNPKRLPVPLAMTGQHKLWKLPKAVHEAAKQQLELN